VEIPSISSIISWTVFGLVVGLVARFLLPGRQKMGLITTAILGIAGSFAGSLLSQWWNGAPVDMMAPSGWLGSIGGALVLLIVGGIAKMLFGGGDKD
jgi:uncharacterized membrane protein YeaQ/YmgE (transglycosylase-associated protein family)